MLLYLYVHKLYALRNRISNSCSYKDRDVAQSAAISKGQNLPFLDQRDSDQIARIQGTVLYDASHGR